MTPENENDMWLTLYGDMENADGKTLCVSSGRCYSCVETEINFRKRIYETNYTEVPFVLTQYLTRDAPVYRIKDLLDKPIQITFYPQELKKVHLKICFEEYHLGFER